jgi:hypothetical protein
VRTCPLGQVLDRCEQRGRTRTRLVVARQVHLRRLSDEPTSQGDRRREPSGQAAEGGSASATMMRSAARASCAPVSTPRARFPAVLSGTNEECLRSRDPARRAGNRLAKRYRAGRTRTCNPRFWRPVLCQLSYGPTRLGEEALYRRASEAPWSALPRPRGRVRRRRRLRRALGGRCVGGRGRGRRPRGLDGGVGAAGPPVGKAAISDESLILRGDGRAG